MIRWNKLIEGESVPPHDIVEQMVETEQYCLEQARESLEIGEFDMEHEQRLDEGAIKVWTNDLDEVVIHHAAGLTLALNWNEAVDLFRWLQIELEQRGDIDTPRER